MNTINNKINTAIPCPFNLPTHMPNTYQYLCINEVAIRAIGFGTCTCGGVYGAPFPRPCGIITYENCIRRGFIIEVKDTE